MLEGNNVTQFSPSQRKRWNERLRQMVTHQKNHNFITEEMKLPADIQEWYDSTGGEKKPEIEHVDDLESCNCRKCLINSMDRNF